MSDTDTKQAEQAAPRKRGRPPKKKLVRLGGPMREPRESMRQEQIRESELDESFTYQPFQNIDPLHIDGEVLRSIEHDFGFRLQWCVESVLGQPQDEIMSAHRKNKFQAVGKGSFGGQLDYLCDREGRIAKGGMVLMARPYQIDDQARSYERKAAKRAVEDMRRKHSDEGVNVTMPGGGRDPLARAHNRHASSFERVQVPED